MSCFFIDLKDCYEMKTPLTAKILREVLSDLEWDQTETARRVKLARPQVSLHLAAARPVRDDHLAKYLKALPSADALRVLNAWMKDVVKIDVLNSLGQEKWTRVAKVQIDATPEVKAVMQWWAEQMAGDAEMETIFMALSRRMGFDEKKLKH
jgi:hypothetical protein